MGHRVRAMLAVWSDYGVSEAVGPRRRNAILVALHIIYYFIMKKCYDWKSVLVPY